MVHIYPRVLDEHGKEIKNDTKASKRIRDANDVRRCVPKGDLDNMELLSKYNILAGTSDLDCKSFRPTCIHPSGHLHSICEFKVEGGHHPFNMQTLDWTEDVWHMEACMGWRVLRMIAVDTRNPNFFPNEDDNFSRDKVLRSADKFCTKYLGPEFQASRDVLRKHNKYYVFGFNPEHDKVKWGEYPARGSLWYSTDKGSQVYCERTEYTAPDLPCCLRTWPDNIWGRNIETTTDYPNDDIQNKDNCFYVDPETLEVDSDRTCKPETASRDTPTCSRGIAEYCMGNTDIQGNSTSFNVLDTSWIRERWIDPNPLDPDADKSICEEQLDLYLSQPSGPGATNAINLLDRLIHRMRLTRHSINDARASTSPETAQIWNLINNYCKSYPGVCDQALFNFCSQYSYQDLLYDQPLTELCGCFLPQAEYNQYSSIVSMPRQCAPICNQDNTIKTGNLGLMQWDRCDRDICLIDDLTINAIYSDIDVNVSQVCGGCGAEGGQCTCIMSNLDFTAVDSNVRLDIEQNCHQTTCHNKQDGNVNCQTGLAENTKSTNLFTGNVQDLLTNTQVLVIIVVLTIVFGLLALFIMRYVI